MNAKLIIIGLLMAQVASGKVQQLNVSVKPIKHGQEMEVLVRGNTAKKIFDRLPVAKDEFKEEVRSGGQPKFLSRFIKKGESVTCIEFTSAKTQLPDYSCAFALNKSGDSRGVARMYDNGGVYSETKAEEVDANNMRFYFYDQAALRMFNKLTNDGQAMRDTTNISCSKYISNNDHKNKGICTVDVAI